jgi:ABC-type Na+ efflux pump permease subunit
MGYRLLLSALLAISVFYTFLARRIPMDPWTAEELINARTLPTLYGSLLSIILILLLFRSTVTTASIDPGRLVRGLGLFGLVFGFVALLGLLNLWLALGILLLTTAWWLGERRWLPMLLLALSIPMLGYLGIELGLGVYLPD